MVELLAHHLNKPIPYSRQIIGLRTYCIYNENQEEIGCIVLINKPKRIQIHYLFIREDCRNIGYGREIIEFLKTHCKIITGTSTISSIDFWKKNGAIILNKKFDFLINQTKK